MTLVRVADMAHHADMGQSKSIGPRDLDRRAGDAAAEQCRADLARARAIAAELAAYLDRGGRR